MRSRVTMGVALLLFLAAMQANGLTTSAAQGAATSEFTAAQNEAVHVRIDAPNATYVQLRATYDVTGTDGVFASFEVDSNGLSRGTDRVIVFLGDGVDARVSEGSLAVGTVALPLARTFYVNETWSGTPGNVTLMSGWTGGGVTQMSVVVESDDPAMAVTWSSTSSVGLLSIRDFHSDLPGAEVLAGGAGAAIAEDATAAIEIEHQLTGFAVEAGESTVGSSSLEYEGPTGSGDASDIDFFNAPSGTYSFSASQVDAGIFPTSPYILYADMDGIGG